MLIFKNIRMNKLIFANIFFNRNKAQNVSNKFPNNFRFGIGSASYQIEGAWDIAGFNLFYYFFK